MTKIQDIVRAIILNPMFLMLILTFATFVSIELFRVPANDSTFDQVLFYFIAGVSLLSALFMIVRTSWDGWTVLGSGLVSHFLAVALVYFLSSWYSTHTANSFTPELVILARSLLIISGVFVFIGVMKELTENTRLDLRCWAVNIWKKVRRK